MVATDSRMRQIRQHPLLFRYLVKLGRECEHRQFTGKFRSGPCCRSEGGRVFRCTLYEREPSLIYDCVLCRFRDLSERRDPILDRLVRVSAR